MVAFDSCYGIICLYNHKTIIPSITLWNPSIRRKLNVPEIPNFNPFEEYSSVEFGFGYNPIADDYNVVGLSYGTTLQALYLYSTKKNAWSQVDLPEADPPFKVQSAPCFVDGAMHWVVRNNSPNTNDSYILTFDLSSRVFGAIPLPSTTRGTINLSIYEGYLTLLSDDGEDSSMWLRKLDDNNNNVASWSKPFKVRYFDVTDGTRVYKVKKDEQLEVPNKAYNPFTEAFHCTNSCVKYEFDSYMETLALLDNDNCSTNKETNMFEKILSVFRCL
ncbi:F-box/kelch-repeat protein At3g23880-like [Rutidosis leptorrhynchoides]|uniref:F-box/kelch-repeat protein At3g23880-like n=1 Tax=Rutidosis leptorrhynchoides TaxID=125765 RepID=UPI003A99879F